MHGLADTGQHFQGQLRLRRADNTDQRRKHAKQSTRAVIRLFAVKQARITGSILLIRPV